MTLGDLKNIVDDILKCSPTAKDCEVTVPVSGERSVCATPSVKVRSAQKGFDFDGWQFMLSTEEPLYKRLPK